LPVDFPVADRLELEVLLGIEIDVGDVPFLLGDLELVDRRPLEILLADELDLVSLLLVVDELARPCRSAVSYS